MKTRKVWFLMTCLLVLSSFNLYSHSINYKDRLPVDDSVIIGKLENGLTYYIKQNKEPENFAELRLVVKAGSILENENQRGLAHFTEHMAFNGTENFPNNTLMEYLNTLGLGFSGGLNAFTSFDETVYMLTSKTDNKENFNKAFLILSDWAARLSFDHDEIDSERGIIMEEWRGGRGASERMLNQQRRVIFENSKYAERMPIGTPDVIENFDYQLIKDFYNDWYRPDLQAVVAVGDFDVNEIKKFIETHFNTIPVKDNPRTKPNYSVPDHEETKFAFATDVEATHTVLSLMHKHDNKSIESIEDYREQLVISHLNQMLNNRFIEISRQPAAPFTQAYASKYAMISPVSVYTLTAIVDETKINDGFFAIISEIERAKRYGFYESELSRAKDVLLKNFERAYNEKNKMSSHRFVWAYVFNFLRDTTMMSVEQEYYLVNDLLSTVNLQDIQRAITDNITDYNRIIGITAPEKQSLILPSENEILDMFTFIKTEALERFPETTLEEALLSIHPQPVKVKKPKFNKELEVYTWTLKNGAKVHLKKTDFKNNEILFSGFRKGGLSQADDITYNSAKSAAQIITESGLGSFNKNLLERYLSGKDVSFQAELRAKNESLSGSSSVKDFEALLQLLYLNFTNPRFDDVAFETWKNKLDVNLRNLQKSPEFAFNESLYNILYNNHLRAKQMSLEDLNNIDHQLAYQFFINRFNSANDFTFIFVGNISHQELHSFIEKYIANLPSNNTDSNIINRKMNFVQSSERNNIFQGKDEKTLVRLIYTNDYNYNYIENLKINATNRVLNEMLLENIRENISGVYSIFSYAIIENDPKQQVAIHISFGCSPERVDEIVEAISEQVMLLINNSFEDKYLHTFKETYKQRMEVATKTNKYWLDQIEAINFHNFSSKDILNKLNIIENFSRAELSYIAKKYFDLNKKLIIVLYPENFQTN